MDLLLETWAYRRMPDDGGFFIGLDRFCAIFFAQSIIFIF
jgi:hypothetical protein